MGSNYINLNRSKLRGIYPPGNKIEFIKEYLENSYDRSEKRIAKASKAGLFVGLAALTVIAGSLFVPLNNMVFISALNAGVAWIISTVILALFHQVKQIDSKRLAGCFHLMNSNKYIIKTSLSDKLANWAILTTVALEGARTIGIILSYFGHQILEDYIFSNIAILTSPVWGIGIVMSLDDILQRMKKQKIE